MGIYLEKDDLLEANNKYLFVKRLLHDCKPGDTVPFIECNKCKGTGLDGKTDNGWSGQFCDKCEGTGYFDVFEDMIKGKGILRE